MRPDWANMRKRMLLLFTLLLMTATTAFAAGPDGILGIWRTEREESKVEIARCGDKICGTIVWLKNPTYSDSREGLVGTPLIDRKNIDPALRSRTVLGMRILEGFTAMDETTWGNGTCYDPKSGKTYRGKMHLLTPDRLELRGYIGIPLFGRSAVWTR
ncbi:MAG: DUF2147 domain-containing protein [Oryzomonas sp.]|jgi:uncharacterized protein (DUF2147 family)